MIGQTLLHYRITDRLGAGGMGEVYRATDTNLNRDVAIKVLPPEVAQDEERLGRFRREAQVLAALNHTNIASIFGLEEADGQPFLVLELVEGEDLKQRLDKGAIPLDEALEIARQIAEALEEAHSRGIVHRDLKPANVKLTPDGKVKVLDFGLAKAWGGDAVQGVSSSASMSQSPTLAHSGTQAGVILGTAAYMSPEQARGKAVDKRSDVWAFGVLLWEMLTGRALFAGESVTDVIAAVVKDDVDFDALPPGTPRAVRRLVARCLRRDPRGRLPDIGAARLDLQEAIAGTPSEDETPAVDLEEASRAQRQSRSRERLAWAAVALAALGLAGYLTVARLTHTPEAQPAGHFVLELPPDLTLVSSQVPTISPDGRRIVFAAVSEGGETALWVRPLESLGSRELPGTGDVSGFPFWSPDSRWVAFFAGGELRRVDPSDGIVQTVCPLPDGWTGGGAWGPDDTLLFSAGGLGARLYTVPASGGEARLFPAPESHGEGAAFWVPELLPNGRDFIFNSGWATERRGLHIASLDAPGETRQLMPAFARAQYRRGHLLFVRDGALLAQHLDVAQGKLTGEARAIASPVATHSEFHDWGWFSASSNGVLTYLEGEALSELVWRDRQGVRLGTVGEAGGYGYVVLSPDERHVAVEKATSGQGTNIWTIDLARGVGTRLTSGIGNVNPVWSPDGREIVFTAYNQGVRLYRKKLLGDEPEQPLAPTLADVWAEGWSPDGQALIYYQNHQNQPGEGEVFGTLGWTEEADPEPFLERPYPLGEPQVSPDGRWLAYISRESERWDVYVEPFRSPGERVRISPEGGGQPAWRADGKELFYVTPEGELMAVAVSESSGRLEVALPERLFGGLLSAPTHNLYAAARDGQRFLVIAPVQGGMRIHVVTNWPSLLEEP